MALLSAGVPQEEPLSKRESSHAGSSQEVQKKGSGTREEEGSAKGISPLLAKKWPLLAKKWPLIGEKGPLIGKKGPLIGKKGPLIAKKGP